MLRFERTQSSAVLQTQKIDMTFITLLTMAKVKYSSSKTSPPLVTFHLLGGGVILLSSLGPKALQLYPEGSELYFLQLKLLR